MDFMTYSPQLNGFVLVGQPPDPVFLIDVSNWRYFKKGITIYDQAGAYYPVTGYYYVVNYYSSTIYAINPRHGARGQGSPVTVLGRCDSQRPVLWNALRGELLHRAGHRG